MSTWTKWLIALLACAAVATAFLCAELAWGVLGRLGRRWPQLRHSLGDIALFCAELAWGVLGRLGRGSRRLLYSLGDMALFCVGLAWGLGGRFARTWRRLLDSLDGMSGWMKRHSRPLHRPAFALTSRGRAGERRGSAPLQQSPARRASRDGRWFHRPSPEPRDEPEPRDFGSDISSGVALYLHPDEAVDVPSAGRPEPASVGDTDQRHEVSLEPVRAGKPRAAQDSVSADSVVRAIEKKLEIAHDSHYALSVAALPLPRKAGALHPFGVLQWAEDGVREMLGDVDGGEIILGEDDTLWLILPGVIAKRALAAAEYINTEARANLSSQGAVAVCAYPRDATNAAALVERCREMLSVEVVGSATSESSYGLLSTDEQRALARLAVFEGTWDLDAAASVCDVGPETLEALVEYSLIDVRAGRFSMPETIREFGVEELRDRGEEDELRRRHALYLVDGAEELAPSSPELEGRALVAGRAGSLRTIAFGFAAAIVGSEAVTAFVGTALGVLCDGVLLLSLLAFALFARAQLEPSVSGARVLDPLEILPVLALVPLAGILSLTMPVPDLPSIYWYAVTGAPLLLAMLLVVRMLGAEWTRETLPFGWTRVQTLIAVSGLPLGLLAYLALRPDRIEPQMTAGLAVVGLLVLPLFTGLTEELFFRGMLQRVLTELFGAGGWIVSAALFTATYLGTRSAPYIAFVALLGLLFGWSVRITQSVAGVSAAHGLVSIGLVLVWPYVLG